MNKITKYCKKVMQNFGCEHSYRFVRNIYGDEINQHNGMRSEWQCIKCGKIEYNKDLWPELEARQRKNKLGNELRVLCNKYNINTYNNWVNSKSESLFNISECCKQAAVDGKTSIDIYIICDSSTDKDNYYKWCKENDLQLDTQLDSEEDLKIKRYKFKISWA